MRSIYRNNDVNARNARIKACDTLETIALNIKCHLEQLKESDPSSKTPSKSKTFFSRLANNFNNHDEKSFNHCLFRVKFRRYLDNHYNTLTKHLSNARIYGDINDDVKLLELWHCYLEIYLTKNLIDAACAHPNIKSKEATLSYYQNISRQYQPIDTLTIQTASLSMLSVYEDDTTALYMSFESKIQHMLKSVADLITTIRTTIPQSIINRIHHNIIDEESEIWMDLWHILQSITKQHIVLQQLNTLLEKNMGKNLKPLHISSNTTNLKLFLPLIRLFIAVKYDPESTIKNSDFSNRLQASREVSTASKNDRSTAAHTPKQI